tara:strand:- start:16954 stop:17574 length:621 start_codon:yes stop_codon:yes gene_type:complete
MKPTIEKIAQDIVAREGGYVNDPDDPGGPTKFGVTIHTMRALGMDLDGDGDVDSSDVKILTIEQANEVFLKHYFYKPKIDQLPTCLHATVFDMQVNSGSNAIKILQRLVNSVPNTGNAISTDGAIGPMTLAKVNAAFEKMGASIEDAYGVERRNYYFRLADRRPSSRKYARTLRGGKGGWIKRAEEFMRPRYRMTNAAFKQRTARW